MNFAQLILSFCGLKGTGERLGCAAKQLLRLIEFIWIAIAVLRLLLLRLALNSLPSRYGGRSGRVPVGSHGVGCGLSRPLQERLRVCGAVGNFTTPPLLTPSRTGPLTTARLDATPTLGRSTTFLPAITSLRTGRREPLFKALQQTTTWAARGTTLPTPREMMKMTMGPRGD